MRKRNHGRNTRVKENHAVYTEDRKISGLAVLCRDAQSALSQVPGSQCLENGLPAVPTHQLPENHLQAWPLRFFLSSVLGSKGLAQDHLEGFPGIEMPEHPRGI